MGYPEIFQLLITFTVIFALESVLSVDNAAVLAVCVKRLPDQKSRNRALTYGIFGAYLFRGLSLLAVGWLLHNQEWGNIAKIIGGGYLFWLVYSHFTPKPDSIEEGDFRWLESALKFVGLTAIPLFWLVVLEVEILDLVFSIDNILAVTAMSDNIYVIVAAVFAAILTMRFVTQKMTKLMDVHPWLESRAYYVIGLIAGKLVLSGILSFTGPESLNHLLHSEWFDMGFSVVSMLLFLPIGIKKQESNPVIQ